MFGDFLSEQQCWHSTFDDGVGVRVIDTVEGAQVGLVMSSQSDQGLQVVTHDFGGDVLHDGLLRKAGDMLEIEALLELFESFLNAPALVVKAVSGHLMVFKSDNDFLIRTCSTNKRGKGPFTPKHSVALS